MRISGVTGCQFSVDQTFLLVIHSGFTAFTSCLSPSQFLTLFLPASWCILISLCVSSPQYIMSLSSGPAVFLSFCPHFIHSFCAFVMSASQFSGHTTLPSQKPEPKVRCVSVKVFQMQRCLKYLKVGLL